MTASEFPELPAKKTIGNADVVAVNIGKENASIRITNLGEAHQAAAKDAAQRLATYVMESTGAKLEVVTNPKGDAMTVSGEFSADPKDYNSQGAIAASLIIGLVKAKAMDDVGGFNAFQRLRSQDLIGIDDVAKGLKAIGFTPQSLPDGTSTPLHEARGRH